MFSEYIKKNRLKNAFRIGDISYKRKKGSKTFKSYPYIVDYRERKEAIEYVFKLPQGLNPEELMKKEYVFRQVFGQKYTLEGDGLVYVLRVFVNDIDQTFDFEWKDIGPYLSNASFPILAGKDALGKVHVYDMVTNPHLLIAGETGSGKSVTVRAIITSILLHMRTRVDLYLGDMKRSEFHLFRNVEGVKAVMTKKSDLLKCLTWLKGEMERRGDLLDAWEVEHIDEYNKLEGVTFEKYILLAIDEVALLKKEKDMMSIVEEISCIGRALGVYLILSMQRPDAKVLEGQLKNNLTVRYAFRHSDKINSDITLGRGTPHDASTISNSEKGRFIFRGDTTQTLQAPLLELKVARKLLEPYKKTVNAKEVNEDLERESREAFMELPFLECGDDE
ncbi:FtsK/SpoIIIE domain-containing protein [Halobacillus aidingensis]|uniref:DNA segregation ATPase FtsK/SpoIIIE, S-DNA-T family n=1 Tax=Halobacillus aidingensis TaxID=240303 RepID=A0A1H0ME42_HALAD|nr:FtsK/SpoIIIE domain-containing protein [Halobacillus aidingensis]SDO78536.1 DNA segregation ATPase FtsK/SpoIIIE, S-DNA-T family [Halobacillus aidingensis]